MSNRTNRGWFWKLLVLFIVVIIGMGVLSLGSALTGLFNAKEVKLTDASVLVLDLEGVILDSKKFTKDLREHMKKDRVKAVVIRVNSPGGVVGPSQEIYSEILRLKEEHEKPVVMSFNGLAASGAYYVAVAGDRIVTNPGTLVGSIGVIMEFANLEGLYEWAKIQPFTIKTGKFKDTGATHRSMSGEEREYIQGLVDEVLEQFKSAIAENRKMNRTILDEYADGRVFTGKMAVDLGFADKVGNFMDAVEVAKELAGEENLEIYDPNANKPPFLQFFGEIDGESGLSLDELKKVFRLQLVGRPLYLMPGAGL